MLNFLAIIFLLLSHPGIPLVAEAGIGTKIATEGVEYAFKLGAREVAETSLERFASKMAKLSTVYGDDVVAAALRKVGPRTAQLVDEAGEHAGLALRLMGRYGDDVAPLIQRPGSLALISRMGDDAAEVLLKHGTVGANLVEQLGAPGVRTLVRVSPRGGRQLAMLAADGPVNAGLLDVVERFGDRAADFIWRNKTALGTGAVLATFLANPEPYLTGAVQLSQIGVDGIIRPVVEIPATLVAEAAAQLPWGFVPVVLSMFLAAGWIGWTIGKRLRARIVRQVERAIGERATSSDHPPVA